MDKVMIVFIIVVGVYGVVSMMSENNLQSTAAKNGLQQCVVKDGIRSFVVWKKDCEKG
jgi:hypothetical protein